MIKKIKNNSAHPPVFLCCMLPQSDNFFGAVQYTLFISHVGHQLDVIARQALWNVGLDYLHGTGHGVGSFLNVHEGPQSISPKAVEDAAIKEGMILSDGVLSH